MLQRLVCGCLRDRQILQHHPYTQQDAPPHAEANDDDEDEMAVVELPPLPTAAAARSPANKAKAKPTPTEDLIGLHDHVRPAAAAAAAAAAASSPPPPPKSQAPTSLRQQQQPKAQPTTTAPAPAPAAPSSRSPAAPQSPPPPSPSPRSPALVEDAGSSPSRLSRSAVASPLAASSSNPTKPPATTAGANWADAWAPMVREQQQAEAQEKAKQEFVAALGQGIGMVKHDRKGHSRLRELYSPDEGQSFSWRHPQPQPGKEKGPGAGAGAAHHQRGASGVGAGAGVFERGRAVYAFHEILEVRRGTVPDPSTGGKESGTETLRASCPKSDLYKSFSLILKDRSVDFTCHSIEQMTYLVKGISTLMAEQKRALLKARAAAAGGTGTEAPASPGRTTAAY